MVSLVKIGTRIYGQNSTVKANSSTVESLKSIGAISVWPLVPLYQQIWP